MKEKLRSKSGFTLSELLTATLTLMLIIAVIAAVSVSASDSSRMNRLKSRSLLVSDTVNTAVRDILSDAVYVGVRDGCVRFINERYSPSEASLADSGGVLVLTVYSGANTGESFTPLANASYGGFELTRFELVHKENGYYCTYMLSCDGFSESKEFAVIPIEDAE